MKNKVTLSNIVVAIVSAITAMGLSCDMSMAILNSTGDISDKTVLYRFLLRFILVMDPNRLMGVIIAAAVFFLLTKSQKLISKAVDFKIAAVALVFSFMQIIGVSFNETNSGILLYLTEDGFVIFRSLLFIISYTVLWYIAIVFMIKGMEIIAQNTEAQGTFEYRKYFIKVFICLLVCWIPYYIIFFPGIGNGDTSKQLLMFFKERDLVISLLKHAEEFADDIYVSNQHPYFTTLLYGFFVKVGLAVTGHAYVGIAAYCFVQMVCYAVAFSYALAEFCSFFGSGGENQVVRYTRYFVMFFPLIPIASISMIKDYTYAVGFIPLVVILAKLIRDDKNEVTKSSLAGLVFVSAFICLTRSQGPYVMAVIGVALFAKFVKPHWKKATKLFLCCFVPVILFFTLWSRVFLPAMNVAPAGKQEMLGILFQQTARYVKEYPDDVTEEEREAIDAVLKYDKLAERYDPVLHDPVKHTYKNGASSEALRNYFKAWLLMFMKHPGVYIEAAVNNSYGAFWVDYYKDELFISCFINRMEEGHYLYIDSRFTNDDLVIIRNIVGALQRIPIVNLFFSVSTYTLMSILAVLYLFRIGKGKYNIANLFVVLAILCLLISPVNGHYRYVSAMMILSPVTFLICVYAKFESNAKNINIAD